MTLKTGSLSGSAKPPYNKARSHLERCNPRLVGYAPTSQGKILVSAEIRARGATDPAAPRHLDKTYDEALTQDPGGALSK